MTRLANIEKAGYFPLPPSVTDLIVSHVTAPHGGRMLDPCAGEGTALVTLAQQLGLEPFGVELHDERAETARQKMTDAGSKPQSLLHDSYLNLVTSRGGYNLLYLNPPYDHDEADGRLEHQWLVRCRPWLQAGGVLAWVVPQHMLRFRAAMQHILSWYERVQVYRFPDESYDQFRQIVLFGVLRRKSVVADGEMVAQWALLAQGKEALPPLPLLVEPSYVLPPLAVKGEAFKFRAQFIEPAEALAEAREMGASRKGAWQEHLDATRAGAELWPLMPLKIGHMHSIIAAGHLNNQVLRDETGERLLIKGRSYKVTQAQAYSEPLPDGRTRVTHLETESVVTGITSLGRDGEARSYKGGALEQFLQRWIGPLTGIVAQAYPPVYTFDLNGYGGLLNRLSKERAIPGMGGANGAAAGAETCGGGGIDAAGKGAGSHHRRGNGGGENHSGRSRGCRPVGAADDSPLPTAPGRQMAAGIQGSVAGSTDDASANDKRCRPILWATAG